MSTPDDKEYGLPEHVDRSERGGLICRHCASEVDGEGLSLSIELAEAEQQEPFGAIEAKFGNEADGDSKFADAIGAARGRRIS